MLTRLITSPLSLMTMTPTNLPFRFLTGPEKKTPGSRVVMPTLRSEMTFSP